MILRALKASGEAIANSEIVTRAFATFALVALQARVVARRGFALVARYKDARCNCRCFKFVQKSQLPGRRYVQ